MTLCRTTAFATPAAWSLRRRRPGHGRLVAKCSAGATELTGEDVLAGVSRVGAGTWSWGNKVRPYERDAIDVCILLAVD